MSIMLAPATSTSWTSFEPASPALCSHLPAPPPSRRRRQQRPRRRSSTTTSPGLTDKNISGGGQSSPTKRIFVLDPVFSQPRRKSLSTSSIITDFDMNLDLASSPTRRSSIDISSIPSTPVRQLPSIEPYNSLNLATPSRRSFLALGYTSFGDLYAPRSPTSHFSSPSTLASSSPEPTRSSPHSRPPPPAKEEDLVDPLDSFFGISSLAESKALRSGYLGLGIEFGVRGGWKGVREVRPLLDPRGGRSSMSEEEGWSRKTAETSRLEVRKTIKKKRSVKNSRRSFFMTGSSSSSSLSGR